VLISLLLLSLATASISITISKSKITLSFRNWLSSKNPWLGDFINCPYCISHWISAILVLFSSLPLNPIISIFAIISISTIIEGLMFKLFFDQESEIERLRSSLNSAYLTIKSLVEKNKT